MNLSESDKNLAVLMERIQSTNSAGAPLNLSSKEMAMLSQYLDEFMAEISTMEIQDPNLIRQIEAIKFFLKMYQTNPPISN
jgi:hypothetical protein